MKNLVPVVVVLLLLGVGGYYVMNMKSSKPPVMEQKTTGTTEQKGNIFTSIQDALSKSLSLKCEYPNPDGKGGTVTSYIKNGAVRVMSIAMGPQGNGSAIMKSNKMWIWDDVKKTGMMLSFDPSKVVKPTGGTPSTDDQSAKVLAEMEKYKNYCKTEVVADSLFTPPTDVKFTDLESMMKGFKVPSGGAPSGVMPSGVIIPTQGEEPNQ